MRRGYSSIGRGLAISAARSPHKPALVEVDRLTLTYQQLHQGAIQLANRLARAGIRKGDHVAVLSDNSVEHMLALYGIAKIGAVSVAFDPRWTPAETARAIAAFDCRLVIADETLERLLSPFPSSTCECGTIVYRKHKSRCELLDIVADESTVSPDVVLQDDEICTIILTSGTTGLPKGVKRTHRNVEVGCIKSVLGKGQDETGRELAVVPINYAAGRTSVIGQIYLGATVFVLSQFDAERVAAITDREKITAVALAPTMCRRLLQLPRLDRFDFRSLLSLRKAGSPFSLAMATEVIERITPNIYQGYSSTETGSVTVLKPHDQLPKIGSSGRPDWGVEIELVDPSTGAVIRGGEGEIRVRGPNVCVGYYKNPEEEQKAFRDGWFHTGDIGRFDADGYLYVVGRIKDMIKTGSISVSPREIENVILSLPWVEDAAVVGVSDAEWGEAVKAFVVGRGKSGSAQAVIEHCRGLLAGYKIPKSVAFVDSIERNELGKVTQEFKSRAR
jgi:acyl-CoA synthetase (AMP-forming)/AMP-acid ligase II